MSAREKILAAVKSSQPAWQELPQQMNIMQQHVDKAATFKTVLQSIGGTVYEVNDLTAAAEKIKALFANEKRMVTVHDAFTNITESYNGNFDAHLLEDVDVAIIDTHFAVAENGSVWVTEDLVKERVLPFICQHLVAVVNADAIVNSMHDAYDKIALSDYGFGVFIAGPSKTADIEQSLVLGAHGPKSMTILLLPGDDLVTG
jgi:L-lactate dehydrogenase complex protein LldG